MGSVVDNHEINNVDALLAAGWIHVTEQMPPNVTPVLAFGWCCDVCHDIVIAEYEVDEWWESYNGENLTFKPEYWMPLPFPLNLRNASKH